MPLLPSSRAQSFTKGEEEVLATTDAADSESAHHGLKEWSQLSKH